MLSVRMSVRPGVVCVAEKRVCSHSLLSRVKWNTRATPPPVTTRRSSPTERVHSASNRSGEFQRAKGAYANLNCQMRRRKKAPIFQKRFTVGLHYEIPLYMYSFV
ncbi:hypothetical protein CDAR_127471 [Caerostris darwini]|uniref:Uncharacterized protein n=1 Tax=Caerostris darwini TaxID=1538125 RepID=A0AAV4UVF5_9ARAC|nr:hypothetical protein CDAR_127471 [Caerostris darwini]